MSPYTAEVIGTMMLVLFGNGVVANVVLARTKGNDAGWIVIAAGWGIAVFVGAFCANEFSGAHLNPAVTVRPAGVLQIADAIPTSRKAHTAYNYHKKENSDIMMEPSKLLNNKDNCKARISRVPISPKRPLSEFPRVIDKLKIIRAMGGQIRVNLLPSMRKSFNTFVLGEGHMGTGSSPTTSCGQGHVPE